MSDGDEGWEYTLIKLAIYFYSAFWVLSFLWKVPNVIPVALGYVGWIFVVLMALYLIISE